MAFDNEEELNRRRREREARRKQQIAEQRKLRNKLILAGAVLLVCAVAMIVLIGSSSENAKTTESTSESTEGSTQATQAFSPLTQEKQETTSRRNTKTVVHIKAAGDLNITDNVILAGASATGYDFTACFQDVAPILSDADLTIVNLEGNICGEPYGTATTSAPIQLAQALQAAGVDLVQMANSCAVNNGISGLTSTLANLRSAGLEPVGAFANDAEFENSKGYTICNVNGVSIAVVAFTKGVGSHGLPTGSESAVNLLYTDYTTTYEEINKDEIKSVLRAVAAEKPDITIALLHWGSEYNDNISSSQTKIVELMQSQGVDVILGTHPHMVHKVEYDEEKNTLVAYSLGDFFGDATRAGTNYSVILDVEITKDSDEGTTTITGFSYTPIYTLTETEAANQKRQVVSINEAIYAYENNYLNKVTKSAYTSMQNALERIDARIAGEDS